MQSIYLLATIISIYSTINTVHSQVTWEDLDGVLRAEIIAAIDASALPNGKRELIGSVVRLIFHDCMGPKEGINESPDSSICDGCIDLDNGAHAGLESLAVNVLEIIYQDNTNNWHQKMNRADFWAAVATIALQYATELAQDGNTNTDYLPYIPFYIGRTNCSASPDLNLANYATPFKDFPSATGGYQTNFQFFQDTFNYDVREYVAILGAHTLGRLHTEHSGFGSAPWVRNFDFLDNAQYRILVDSAEGWIQQETSSSTDDNWEWINNGGSTNFRQLNADMALVKDLDNGCTNLNGDGECGVSCTYDTCGDNTNTLSIVQEYAGDNQQWLIDFADAFTKMITTGYDTATELTALATPFECNSVVYNGTNGPNPGDLFWTRTFNNIEPEDQDEEIELEAKRIQGMGARRNAQASSFRMVHPECADSRAAVESLKYWYRFRYNAVNKRLMLDVHACCPQPLGFGSGYQNKPPGATWIMSEMLEYGQPSIFDDDWDEDSWELTIDKIILFIICFIVLISGVGCCIYYRRKKKKKASEKEVKNHTDVIQEKKRINNDSDQMEHVVTSVRLSTNSIGGTQNVVTRKFSNGDMIQYTNTKNGDDNADGDEHSHQSQHSSSTSLV